MSQRNIELLTPKTSMVTEDWLDRQMVVAIVDSVQKMVTILDKFGNSLSLVSNSTLNNKIVVRINLPHEA